MIKTGPPVHGLLAKNLPCSSGCARDHPMIWRWPIFQVELRSFLPITACPGCPMARFHVSHCLWMRLASGTVPIPVMMARCCAMIMQWSSGKTFLIYFQPSSTHLLIFVNFQKEGLSRLLQIGKAKLKMDYMPLFICLIR